MNKDKKTLLNEELQKFKMMTEYAWYEERIPAEKDDELIFGNELSEEEESSDDAGEGFGDAELDIEEPAADEEIPDEEPMDEPAADDIPAEEPVEDDAVELDVTELVNSSEEAKASADAANAKIDQLMGMVAKLESQTKSMEAIGAKIDNLEWEIEKRAPTEQEKLEMRSLDSAPYNLKLTDFWKDQEGAYDVMGTDKEKEYVLTKDEIDSDYSETDIKKSLDLDNPYEEDDI